MDKIKHPIKLSKRAKESCPRIRNNYKKYQKAEWKWIDVFKLIDMKKNWWRSFIYIRYC